MPVHCVTVFRITVPSNEVIGFDVFYDVIYNVIDDVLGRFGVTLVWVRRIHGGIGTHVFSRVWWACDFRFVTSVYVRGRIYVSSRDGCRPVYGDSIGDLILPNGHCFGSFR